MTIDLKHITVAFDYTSGVIADIKGVWNAYTRRQRERVRSTGNSV